MQNIQIARLLRAIVFCAAQIVLKIAKRFVIIKTRSVYEIRRKLFSKRQKSRRAEVNSKRAFGRRTGPLERQTAKESVCAQQCVEDAPRRAFVDCVRHVFYRYAYKNRRYDPGAGNRIFVRVFLVPPHARVDMDL